MLCGGKAKVFGCQEQKENMAGKGKKEKEIQMIFGKERIRKVTE